jgi:hypothetical protein
MYYLVRKYRSLPFLAPTLGKGADDSDIAFIVFIDRHGWRFLLEIVGFDGNGIPFVIFRDCLRPLSQMGKTHARLGWKKGLTSDNAS